MAGQANALCFIPHLHFQKTTGMVNISNTGVERIVTDPELPGFQMKIPAGVQIIGWDGQPNTQLSVRRVPIDRIPVPPPGAQAELWVYDEAPDGSRPNQWAKYGTGTVSPDGSHIVPDIDPNTGKPYGQLRFCCGINFAGILQAVRGSDLELCILDQHRSCCRLMFNANSENPSTSAHITEPARSIMPSAFL